jgi:HSP20 family protein
MKNKALQSHSVYPGEFIPMADEALVVKQTISMRSTGVNLPYTNVKELIDEYKIEIAAPGFRRDKLIVYADTNDLLVCATPDYDEAQSTKSFQRHVKLPGDADVELAIAEYRNNILELYVPKTKQPCKTGTARIIVY